MKMNKNVNHSGEMHEKGLEIAKDHKNYAMFLEAGHLEESDAAPEAPVVEAPMEVESNQPAPKKRK